MNYEAMDAEHRKLLGVIRDASSETKREPTDSVTLQPQVRLIYFYPTHTSSNIRNNMHPLTQLAQESV